MSIIFWIVVSVHLIFFLTFCGNRMYMAYYKRQQKTPATYPHVSVIIPARNEAENLARLLPSLTTQQYPSFEVLVYNDHSEDETGAIIDEIAASSNVPIRHLKGETLPENWLGKPHALYQATRHAQGEMYIFLDADAHLRHTNVLETWIKRMSAVPQNAYFSGIPIYRGGGLFLVSQIGFVIMAGIPMLWMKHLPLAVLSMLNGQFWMIRKDLYHQFEPHLAKKDEILEDVLIGRYLKTKGLTPYMWDVRDELEIWMYTDFKAAWHGFRKNTYLLMGGTPLKAILSIAFTALSFTIVPLFFPVLFGLLYFNRFLQDQFIGAPFWMRFITPLAFPLIIALQIASTWAHWTKQVAWKGRSVR